MVFACRNEDFRIAAAETPAIDEDRMIARLYRIDGWHMHQGLPDDIPVLPGFCNGPETVDLVPYDTVFNKVSMFPRVSPLCLK